MTYRRMLSVLSGWMGALITFFEGISGIVVWSQSSNLPFFANTGTCILSLVLQIAGGLILGSIFLWAVYPDIREILSQSIKEKEGDNEHQRN